MDTINQATDTNQPHKEQERRKGTFYLFATCILFPLILDIYSPTHEKGFRLYLFKLRRVYKILLAQLLVRVFNFIDKHWKIKQYDK